MIRQYNFPNIFHNIVGQIIPQYVLERMNRPDLIQQYLSRNGSHQNSIKFSSESDSNSAPNGGFGPKIKKKKIFMRSNQFNRTNYLLSQRQKQSDKETIKSEQTPELKSFLSKKQSNLTEMSPQKDSQGVQQNQIKSQQSEITIQASFSDIDAQQLAYQQKQTKKKRALYRVRTSIDRPLELSGITEEGQDDLYLTMKRNEQNKINLWRRVSNNSAQHLSSFNSQRPGQFSKMSIQKQESLGKMSLASKIATNRNVNQKLSRKNNKKKTVNFANSRDQSQASSIIRRNSRKGTLLSNFSKITKNQSGKSKNNHKLTRFKVDDNFSELQSMKTISVGTGKSVISIKLDDSESGNHHINARQKSLRSNESILKTERNLRFKNTLKKTRTAKFINNHQNINVEKSFKSQKHIKNHIFGKFNFNKKQKQFVLKRRNRSKGSKKSNHGSQKKLRVKKPTISRASIMRKGDIFQYNQASINKLLSIKQCNSLSELIVRKQTSRALNKTILRNTLNQDNVYDELNDFLKFFHEKENISTENQIKKTFNKPVIIADQIKMRKICNNKQSFDKQNLCIDMGIKLMKRMNRLAQKKY